MSHAKLAAILADPNLSAAIVELAKHAVFHTSGKESTDKTAFDETTEEVERRKQDAERNGGTPTEFGPNAMAGASTISPSAVSGSPTGNIPQSQPVTTPSGVPVAATGAPVPAAPTEVPQGNSSSLSPDVTQTSANGSTPNISGDAPGADDENLEAINGQSEPGEMPMQMSQGSDPFAMAAQVAQSFIGEEVYNAASQGHLPAIQLIAETAARLGAAIAAQSGAAPAPAPMPMDPAMQQMPVDPTMQQAPGTPAPAAQAAPAPAAPAQPPQTPTDTAADAIVKDPGSSKPEGDTKPGEEKKPEGDNGSNPFPKKD